MISIVLIFFFISWIVLCDNPKNNILSPFGVFNILWIVGLAIVGYAFPYHYLSPKVHLLIILSWCSAYCGVYLANLSQEKIAKKNINIELIFYILLLLSLIGCIRMGVVVYDFFGMAVFKNPLLVRTELTMGVSYSLGKLTQIFWGIDLALAVISGMYASKNKNSLVPFLVFVPALVTTVFFVGRTHLFMVSIVFIFSYMFSIDFKLKNINKVLSMIFLFSVFYLFYYMAQYRSYVSSSLPFPQWVMKFIQMYENIYGLNFLVENSDIFGTDLIAIFARPFYIFGFSGSDFRDYALGAAQFQLPDGGISNKYTLLGDVYGYAGYLGVATIFFTSFYYFHRVYLLGLGGSIYAKAVLPFVYLAIALTPVSGFFNYPILIGGAIITSLIFVSHLTYDKKI